MAATASTANLRDISERMRAPYVTDRRLVAARVPAAQVPAPTRTQAGACRLVQRSLGALRRYPDAREATETGMADYNLTSSHIAGALTRATGCWVQAKLR